MKKLLISTLINILILCFTCQPVFSAVTYHWVDTSGGSASWAACAGSDPGAGNRCSMSQANLNAVADDWVIFQDGIYNTQLNPSNSGTSGHPITFQSLYEYTSGVSGTPYGWRLEYASPSINLQGGQSYIVIDGFGSQNEKTSIVLSDYGAHDIEVKNFQVYYNSPSTNNTWSYFKIGPNSYHWNVHHFTYEFTKRGSNEDGGLFMNMTNLGGYNYNRPHDNWIHDFTMKEGPNHDFMTITTGYHNVIENGTLYNTGVTGACTGTSTCDNGPNEFMGSEKTAYSNLYQNLTMHEEGVNFGDHWMNGIEPHNTKSTIFRRNIVYNTDGFAWLATGTSNTPGTVQHNRIYNNTAYNVMLSGYGDANTSEAMTLYNYYTLEMSDNKLFNNIIHTTGRRAFGALTKLGTAYLIMSGSTSNEYFSNWLYNIGSDDVRYYTPETTPNDYFTMTEAQTNWPDAFHGNTTTEVDPKLTNPSAGNMTLQSNSPCIDAGEWLATITSSNGSGTTFTVDDAYPFFDGIQGLGKGGDIIKTESGQTGAISSINYDTGQITLTSSIQWIQGEGIALSYYGTKPDIGYWEYTLLATDVSPADGDTGVSITPTITWDYADFVDGVDLWIKSGLCSTVGEPYGTPTSDNDTDKTYTSGTLSYDTDYCLVLQAYDGAETGAYQEFDFRTVTQQNPPPPTGFYIEWSSNAKPFEWNKNGVSVNR